MATAASRVSNKNGGENREKLAKQVAQQLRNDLHMISNEARKKHPAVREVSLTRLGKLVQLTLPILSPNLLPRLYRQLNEAPCVSRTSQNRKALLFKVFRHTVCTCEPVCHCLHAVLSATDDIIHPLLFACDSKNPLVQLALSAHRRHPVHIPHLPIRCTGTQNVNSEQGCYYQLVTCYLCLSENCYYVLLQSSILSLDYSPFLRIFIHIPTQTPSINPSMSPLEQLAIPCQKHCAVNNNKHVNKMVNKKDHHSINIVLSLHSKLK